MDELSWTTELIEPFYATLLDKVPEGERGLVEARIRAVADELLASVEDVAVDGPTRGHVLCAAHGVAAYRWLRAERPHEDAVEAVRRAAIEPLSEWMASMTRHALDASEDPFSTVVAICKWQEGSFFKRGFAFEPVVDTDRRYLARANHCPYHEVNVRLGAPELTGAVWCEWDEAWLSVVDPERDRMQASRPVTIGRGCDHCDFGFTRE